VREGVERFIADPSFAPHAIVVTAALRPLLAEFFDRVGPRIDVYAFSEIPPGTDLEPATVLDAAH
jgi:flagellar biosynthesis component FlhA